MRLARIQVPLAFVLLCASLPAAATHLVTGNGFGFAVVSLESATLSKFYAHPYCFVRPEPAHPLSEGVETANFIESLAWSGEAGQPASAAYVQDAQIVHAGNSSGEGFFFMPFGLRQNALLIDWDAAPAAPPGSGWSVAWAHPVLSQKAEHILGVDALLLHFKDVEESLVLVPLDSARADPADPQQPLAGARAWALISIESDQQLEQTIHEFTRWRAGLAPRDLEKRELAELEQWRAKPTVHFTSAAEEHLWRQSETMLRMAQSREPNRPDRHSNGLIVAGLPDGLWFTPWVRDMAFATVALIRMGHRAEARAALLAYFNARPTGKMKAETRGADYQISVVRYFGDGAEEPFFTMEGNTNIEFDDWGLVLWALGEYEQRYNDAGLLHAPTFRGPLYRSARDFVAGPLVKNLEPYGGGSIVAADTSIWEEHEKDKKHFAFSTAMAIVGLRDFAAVARRAGDQAARTQALHQAALLQQGFNAAFIRGGELHGTLEEGEKNDIDGALLAIINLGVVKDSAIVDNTIQRMELLQVASGGYRRVRSNYTDPAIFEYWYERQEFLFVDFSLAELYRRQGRAAEAAALLGRIEEKAAADHNIIPEMYVALPCELFPGKIGDATGAKPIVGYGAGAFILNLLARENLPSNEHCSPSPAISSRPSPPRPIRSERA